MGCETVLSLAIWVVLAKGSSNSISRVLLTRFRRWLRICFAADSLPLEPVGTAEALQTVKDELDEETHLDELPAELKGVHDQVCTLLIGKARGDLKHFGDTSALREEQALTVRSPVVIALRSAITAQLEHMVLISEQTNDVSALHELLAQQSGLLEQLLDTAQTFQTTA